MIHKVIMSHHAEFVTAIDRAMRSPRANRGLRQRKSQVLLTAMTAEDAPAANLAVLSLVTTSLVIFLFSSLAGCSTHGDRPEVAPVEGTVALDGQPLVDATVVFHPDQGKISMAKTDENGHYELVYLRDIKGAKLGHHRVEITTWTEQTRQERLPPKYHSQTELEADVGEGQNTHNFDLQST